jgi:RNA polymerase sigma-70 factor (ECF subfamily)
MLLRDEAAAVDAMQDVFVEIVRRKDILEDRGACSYLWTAATRVCLNRIAANKRAPQPSDDDAALQDIATATDATEHSMAANFLNRVFGREPPSTRVMATMFFLDGMTHEEIADAVGMSVSGVRKRLRTLKLRAVQLSEAA